MDNTERYNRFVNMKLAELSKLYYSYNNILTIYEKVKENFSEKLGMDIEYIYLKQQRLLMEHIFNNITSTIDLGEIKIPELIQKLDDTVYTDLVAYISNNQMKLTSRSAITVDEVFVDIEYDIYINSGDRDQNLYASANNYKIDIRPVSATTINNNGINVVYTGSSTGIVTGVPKLDNITQIEVLQTTLPNFNSTKLLTHTDKCIFVLFSEVNGDTRTTLISQKDVFGVFYYSGLLGNNGFLQYTSNNAVRDYKKTDRINLSSLTPIFLDEAGDELNFGTQSINIDSWTSIANASITVSTEFIQQYGTVIADTIPTTGSADNDILVTGTGTHFDTQYVKGDIVRLDAHAVANQYFIVKLFSSKTAMIVERYNWTGVFTALTTNTISLETKHGLKVGERVFFSNVTPAAGGVAAALNNNDNGNGYYITSADTVSLTLTGPWNSVFSSTVSPTLANTGLFPAKPTRYQNSMVVKVIQSERII